MTTWAGEREREEKRDVGSRCDWRCNAERVSVFVSVVRI